ncbi:response regulator transcription factor [Acidicapsa acidisoli]|uniref:response regulator transcription factor n=1 Tax=Acidicapsa acidisoli TaxID=1615681 RepID=UPI0021DFDD6A|nr:response regulator transcription factor [Acidicapsa acidisoli]
MALSTWNILIVDDEPIFRKTLSRSLAASGHSVEEASSGGDAVDILARSPFQFVLLDLNMPGMGGLTTCKMIRSLAPAIGIVVLSVRNEEQDRVAALDAGADDYLTKPFGLSELIARLNAIYRRMQAVTEDEPAVLKGGDLEMDVSGHSVWRAGKAIHLTPKEFELLALLMKNQDRTVATSTLLRTIWGPDYGNESHYLRSYIKALRKKIESDPAKPEYILTEQRIGYRFRNPANEDRLVGAQDYSFAEPEE